MANETTPRGINSLQDIDDPNGREVWLDELQTAVGLLVDKVNGHQGAKFNAVDNPDFAVNQERFSTPTVLTGINQTKYVADRHFVYHNNPGSIQYSRNTTDAPSVEEIGTEVSAVHDVQVTVADAMGTTNEELSLRHRFEGYDVDRHLWNRTCTFSWWVKTNVTGTYVISFHDDFNPTASYAHEFTVVESEVWTRFSVTLDLDDTYGSWRKTTGNGLEIVITLASATTWDNTELDKWISGDFRSNASGRVNLMDTVGNYFRCGIMQMEIGSEPTDFMSPVYADSLVKCQRYYWEWVGAFCYLAGAATSTTSMFTQTLLFPTEMRVVPAISWLGAIVVNGTLGTLVAHNQTKFGFAFRDSLGTYTTNGAILLAFTNLVADARL